jgi:hypothetical protein
VRSKQSLPYFGYQRGEWFDANERECWLWLYGSNLWPETVAYDRTEHTQYSDWEQKASKELWRGFADGYGPQGLDLLNAATGELEPDGIPDGICLLYKLKDGEVVEIIRAEGI